MSAYVEASLTQLLIAHFFEPKLKELLSNMTMGSDRHGKIAFVKALKLLTPEAHAFVNLLNKLRGEIVHKVAAINLNLAEHLNKPEKKNEWKCALLWWTEDKSGTAHLLNPKGYLLTAVMHIMAETALQSDRTRLNHEIDEWARRLGMEQIFQREKGTPKESIPTAPSKRSRLQGRKKSP